MPKLESQNKILTCALTRGVFILSFFIILISSPLCFVINYMLFAYHFSTSPNLREDQMQFPCF
jgi:hypothetical protein